MSLTTAKVARTAEPAAPVLVHNTSSVPMSSALTLIEGMHAVEMERSLIGSLLHDQNRLDELPESFGADDFFDELNRALFATMRDLIMKGAPVDVLVLADVLDGKPGIPSDLLARLGDMQVAVASSANAVYYSKIIKEKSMMRRVTLAAQKSMETIANKEMSTADKLDAVQQMMLDATTDEVGSKAVSVVQLLYPHVEMMEARLQSDPTLIPTSFDNLNEALCGGLHTGDMVVIGARPSMGKTALALNLATGMSDLGHGGLILSMEMRNMQLMDRMLSAVGEIDFGHMRKGVLDADEWERYANAMARMQQSQIWLDESPALSIQELASKVRFAKRKNKIRWVVVDYLQLMRGDPRRQRNEQVEEISRSVKEIAKRNDVCMIALSQMNRGASGKSRPSMSELRNSGSIEQDADIILFPYREEMDNPDTPYKGLAEVNIAKNREGALGRLGFHFDGPLTRFSPYYGELPDEDGIKPSKLDKKGF